MKKIKLLITGGTGSFGNAVLRRYIKTEDFDEIRVFSRDEKKQDDMRKNINDDRIKFYIGDVRDRDSLNAAVKGVDYIFHAAALKQVPSCEFFPIEAIKTNILGTENVLNTAIDFGVKKVIVLSTDKAAYPVNAMGMSKALMEKVTTAKARSQANEGTIFCTTRYGNVMASRGSVIPLFIEQIKDNKALTITNPEMSRFMMTLDDAVDLVLYAFKNGKQGDLFVQKAPSAKINTLASALIELYDSKSTINIIGVRHGEKLYETLVSTEEMSVAEDIDNYYKVPMDHRGLNYDKYLSEGQPLLDKPKEYHSHNTKLLNVEEMKNLLLKLPEINNDSILKK